MAINIRRCATTGGNTGPGACDFDISKALGTIATPLSTVIPQSDFATIDTVLSTNTQLDSRSLRWYPVAPFVGYEPGNANDVREELAYAGISKFVRRGNIDMTWRLDIRQNLAERYNKLLHQSQGRLAHFFVWAIEGGGYAIAGEQIADAAGTVSLKPWRMSDTTFMTPQLPSDSARTVRRIMFSLMNPNYLNENWGFIFTENNPLDSAQGLIDVYLQATAGPTTGHIRVRPIAGTVPMTDDHATALALPAVWKLVNDTTKATITATAAAIVGEEVELTTAVAAGTKVNVSLQAPSVLSTNNMPGFESNTVQVTTT